MHAHHDPLLDVGGAAGAGDERHPIGLDRVHAEARDGGREIGNHAMDINDDHTDRW